MDAELDEELIHLTQIGRITMRVKQSRRRHGMSHIHPHNLRSSTCRQLKYLHVLTVRKGRNEQELSEIVCDKLV